MSRFSDFLNNLNLKTIIAINIFLAVLVMLPLTVYISQRQTRLSGRAYTPLPTIPFMQPTPTPTPPPITPAGPPEISFINPFFGKVNDSVIITGKNFNNLKGQVFFNNILAYEIKSWTNERIHVLVPANATSGLIKIQSSTSPYNFIVLNQKTICQLLFQKGTLSKSVGQKNCPSLTKIKLVFKLISPEFNYQINSLPPLGKEDLKITKSVFNNETILVIEINVSNKLLLEKFLEIQAPPEKKLTLIAAELWTDNTLLPFFINPLSLTN